MPFLRVIFRAFDGLLDRIFSVAGAVLLSQLPNLIILYINALSGALAEARRNVEALKVQARMIGVTADDFIRRLLNSGDPAVQASGRIHQQALERFQEYSEAFGALQSSNPWTRPFVFLQHLDPEILNAVQFTPALPLSPEGAVYALVGVLLALLLYKGVLKLPVHIVRGIRKRRAAPRTA